MTGAIGKIHLQGANRCPCNLASRLQLNQQLYDPIRGTLVPVKNPPCSLSHCMPQVGVAKQSHDARGNFLGVRDDINRIGVCEQ